MVRLEWFQQPGLDRRLPVQAVGALSDFIRFGFIGRVPVTVLTPQLLVAQLRIIKHGRNLKMIGFPAPGHGVVDEQI